MKKLNQVIQLYNAGYKVIPLKGKIPTIKEWQKFYNQPRSEKEVTDLFINTNADNVGMLTGKQSGITVIDIDYKNKDGSAKFTTTLEKFLEEYPTDVVVETGSGNHHLYYQYNPSIKTGTNILELHGADVRNDGGQVVVPPSIHESGKPYKFIRTGMYGTINTKIEYNKESSNNTDKSWITTILEGVSHGGRDDACAKLVGYYHSKGIPLDIIRSLLLTWNEKNNPPLSKQQIEKVIASVTRYEVKKPDQSTKEDVGLSLLPFNEYMTKFSNYTVDWTIPGWLPSDTILFMVAPPSSYKTWLLMDLAVSVAGGYKFLGEYPVEETGPVLIFQQEDHHGQTVSRLATIIQSKKSDLEKGQMFMPDLPIYIQTDRGLAFNNPDRMRELEDLIIKLKPKLVLVDPLYSTIPIDDYMSKGAEYMFPLKTFRDKYKCTFVLAHHSKKSTDTGSMDRTDLWGSQFLNAFLESGWQIRKSTETSIRVKRHYKVTSAQKELVLNFDIHTEFPTRYKVSVKEVTEEMSQGFTRESVLNYMKKLRVITVEKIEKKFSMRTDEVKKMLSLFETDGVITSMGDGTYTMIKE